MTQDHKYTNLQNTTAEFQGMDNLGSNMGIHRMDRKGKETLVGKLPDGQRRRIKEEMNLGVWRDNNQHR